MNKSAARFIALIRSSKHDKFAYRVLGLCTYEANKIILFLYIHKLYFYRYVSTTLHRNYRDHCEKRCCSGSHKQFKTLFKDHMARLKIISLYIYKDLRLKI